MVVTLSVASPLRPEPLELQVTDSELMATVKQHLQALGPLVQPATSFSLVDPSTGEPISLQETVQSLNSPNLSLRLEPLSGADVTSQLEAVRELLGFGEQYCPVQSIGSSMIESVIADAPNKVDRSHPICSQDPTTVVGSEQLRADPNEQKRLARQLELSAWNPVQTAQKMQHGHLAYIRFVALDGKVRHIVASTRGFAHVPQLTEDKWPSDWPSPSSYEHSLFDLLEKLSPATIQQVRHTAKQLRTRDPLSWMPVKAVNSAIPWLVNPPKAPTSHSYALGPSTMELRDWNEDFQAARELPQTSVRERLDRARLLADVSSGFAAAATEGARDIVEGRLIPLNPEETPGAHVFLRNGIFYTYGTDFANQFSELGGDSAARVAARKDLAGVNLLTQLDVSPASETDTGISPVATAVIDFVGRRIIAQGPVPGVFRESAQSQVVYGFTENRDELRADPGFGEALKPVAAALHLKSHERDGVTLVTSADVRGMAGADGRHYALDLARLAPPDVKWLEDGPEGYPHKLVLLRPEAVEMYYSKNPEDPALNNDAWTDDAPAEDRAQLRKLSEFVRTQVKEYVAAVASCETSSPVDGFHLTQALHRRGINVRYLGLVNELCSNEASLGSLKRISEYEAVSRAAKHVLLSQLQHLRLDEVPATVTKFFSGKDNFGAISSECRRRFGIQTKLNALDETLIRSVSRQVGLQWTVSQPTSPSQLAGIQPIVRYACPRASVADEALEAGLQAKEAQVVAEAVAVFSHTYGSVHPEVARAFNQAALKLYGADQFEQAAEAGRKAVTVAERTLGLDAAETLLFYSNLVHFERAAGRESVALSVALHTLRAWPVSERSHVDMVALHHNIGSMLQHAEQHVEAIPWFQEAAVVAEAAGAPSSQLAPVLFALSQSQLVAGDLETSTRTMERSYAAFKTADDTEMAAEARKWLESLLKTTVNIPKLKGMKISPTPQPKVQTKSNPKPNQQQDLNDVLKYILGDAKPSAGNGKSNGKSKKKGKKSCK